MVCAEHAIGLEIILVHLMELIGDVSQVEAHFSPFGDSVNLGARLLHALGQIYHRLRNVFQQTMELLGDVVLMEARFGLL
jgi:hypothetical protein